MTNFAICRQRGCEIPSSYFFIILSFLQFYIQVPLFYHACNINPVYVYNAQIHLYFQFLHFTRYIFIPILLKRLKSQNTRSFFEHINKNIIFYHFFNMSQMLSHINCIFLCEKIFDS